ncbi:MAG: NAD(P)/FAD-dependent oxidoreductase [Bacteroidales bacterium]|nr:NAD(P)/FAD-dependent oxidoreductase [Bacteroidales bacterium]
MTEFEMTGRVGRDLRLDDVRIVAAKVMNLRGNAVINVIDPTKSYQPTFPNAAATCVIARRSIDARNDVIYRYKIEAYDHRFESYVPYEVPEYKDVSEAEPVIIVGAGPAGMFAALKLLTLGKKPIILERGKNVHDRKFDMARLSREGVLDPDSNYCYGEGGAGAFSDGKLFTRSSKRGDIREVLYQLVNFGANPQILVDAHPHIGTDRLPKIVANIRECIESKGGEYHFETKVTGLRRKADGEIEVKALDSANRTKAGKPSTRKYSAKKVILAAGHSAVDVYRMLQECDCPLEPKGFAMGVRVEHTQALINEARYHGQWEPGMPAAEYSFTEQIDERGVFSFCMCPGGVLVPSATEAETIVMNGMSNSARSGKFANAGVVVQIDPEDIPEEYEADGPLKGLSYQKAVERSMWEYAHTRSSHPMAAPAQRMIDFCNGVVSEDLPETSYKPGVVSAPLDKLLPPFISERLKKVFPEVNRHSIRGYFTNEALLVGVESRTSSPVRIPRNPRTYEADSFPGLLPCGEGAGYSGGIVSSAIDGINCAVAASVGTEE